MLLHLCSKNAHTKKIEKPISYLRPPAKRREQKIPVEHLHFLYTTTFKIPPTHFTNPKYCIH